MNNQAIANSITICAKGARDAAARYLSSKDGRVRRRAIKELKKAEGLELSAARLIL